MFLINEQIVISWALTVDPDVVADPSQFDVILITPDGTSTYNIEPGTGWVIPTNVGGVVTKGNVSYTFTPTLPGTYRVQLVTGTQLSYEILDNVRIGSVCEAPLGDPNPIFYPTANILVKEFCGTAPVLIAEANMAGWQDIVALGRGANPDELVILGRYTQTDLNYEQDIGIYNMATDTMTLYVSATATIPLGGFEHATERWAGIDCDPNTGVYVLSPQNSSFIVNEYDTYWTTDFVTWTKQTGVVTTFHGGDFVRWHETFKMWVWASGATTFVSSDGKAWSGQNGVTVADSTSNLGFLEAQPLDPGLNPLGSEWMVFGARNSSAWIAKQTGGAVPLLTTPGTHGLADVRSFSEQNANDGSPWGHTDDEYFTGEFAWTGKQENGVTPTVCLMNQRGEILYTQDTNMYNDWLVASEKDVGQGFPVGPESELTQILSDGYREFTRANGSWWCNRGGSDWWQYESDGPPIGMGWVQTTATPPATLPYQINGTKLGINRHCILRCDQRPLAFASSPAGGDGLDRIYYDVNNDAHQ